MYTAERMLKDAGDKIPITDKNAIENAMADLKKAIEANDAAGMSGAMEALMQAQHKASEALYKNQAEAASGGSSGSTSSTDSNGRSTDAGAAKPEGDVIDAEVVEDDKK
jgi:molecular chaperone DnaK